MEESLLSKVIASLPYPERSIEPMSNTPSNDTCVDNNNNTIIIGLITFRRMFINIPSRR